jgi:uroporphyrinogen III methyltransferase/synthase
MLVGPAVGLRPDRSWFEARPLTGLRVLVTRPKVQALPFVRRLELLGAVPVLLPAVEVREPADWGPADAAIERLRTGGYDWVAFTSANGVTAFFDRLTRLGWDARVLGRVQLAAIGPATAAALVDRRLIPDLVPADDLRSEGLADLLAERCRGGRVLLAQAAQGRELLRERLQAVAEVDVAPVYEQASAVYGTGEAFDRLRRGEIDVVTLTSPNVAKAFLAACDDVTRQRLRDGPTRLVANSGRLAELLAEEGLPAVVAPDPTNEGLVQALIGLGAKSGEPGA